MKISIIIPAKDEEKRLPIFLRSVVDYCLKSVHQYEIIIVDDGSQDLTSEAALKFQKEFHLLKVITLERNHGKGYAVKQGFFAASGDIILFLDADGSTDPQEIERHLPLFKQGYDIVIGSRVLTDGKSQVKTLVYRKLIGIAFNFFVHLLLIKNIKDTQCGFKMFRASVVHNLFGRMYLGGFGFDLELLYLAQKMNYRIKEVAINWTHVDGSKINLIKDSLKMFFNIIQIKNWHYPPINTEAQHMSVKELINMHHQSKKHWWFKAKGEFFRKIVSTYNFDRKLILDAGCGTGHNLEFLRSQGNYVGTDVMFEALEFCQEAGADLLVQGNLKNIGFRSKVFDVVFSLDVIEHITDHASVMQELKRVLKDDGLLILCVPAFRFLWSPHDESLSHMRRYSKSDFTDLIEDSGFKIQRMGYLFGLIFLPVAVIRVFRKIFSKNYQSDTSSSCALLNDWLFRLLQWEVQMMSKVSWPFGTSLYTVVSKR